MKGVDIVREIGVVREIKFRGQRMDNSEWVYGDLLNINPGSDAYICNKGYTCIDDFTQAYAECVDPDTVGQFTGLIRNRDIYEGDICDTHTRWGKGVVFFERGMFKLCGLSLCTFGGLEIIGNIHDNPELLEA